MKDSDVRIGMKVVPHDKTFRGWPKGLHESFCWKQAEKKGKPYLWVVEHDEEGAWALAVTKRGKGDGDFFNASDFEPYKE